MTPETISLLIQGVAAAGLAAIPVYQKWRSVERQETVADREAGLLKDRAMRETVGSWEFWTCGILAVIVLLALANSFAINQKGLEIIQALRATITEYRAETEGYRKRIEATEARIESKLDGIAGNLNRGPQ